MKYACYISNITQNIDNLGDREKANAARTSVKLIDRKLAGILLASAILIPCVPVSMLTTVQQSTESSRKSEPEQTISFAIAPDNKTIATSDPFQRVALSDRADHGSVRRLLGSSGHALGFGLCGSMAATSPWEASSPTSSCATWNRAAVSVLWACRSSGRGRALALPRRRPHVGRDERIRQRDNYLGLEGGADEIDIARHVVLDGIDRVGSRR